MCSVSILGLLCKCHGLLTFAASVFRLLFLSLEWGEDLVSWADDHLLGASEWHFIGHQVLPCAHSAQLIKKIKSWQNHRKDTAVTFYLNKINICLAKREYSLGIMTILKFRKWWQGKSDVLIVSTHPVWSSTVSCGASVARVGRLWPYGCRGCHPQQTTVSSVSRVEQCCPLGLSTFLAQTSDLNVNMSFIPWGARNQLQADPP